MKVRQHSTFMSSVLDDLRNGRLAPAGFQRPYVWTRADVIALLESVLAGFPIGTLLTWYPKEPASQFAARPRLGPIELDLKDRFARLLLDGQNRLATLAWLTHDATKPIPGDLSPSEAAVWGVGQHLVINVAERCFEFRNPEDLDKGFTAPPYVLVDSRDFSLVMRERWDKEWQHLSESEKDDGMRWLDKCGYAFREAQVIDVVLENATVEEAKNAFLHICRTGVPMSEADFDAAVNWRAP